jgi:uncharacterized protein YjbI with pentapeptide repeats
MLDRATLRKATLSHANLEGAVLLGADLTGVSAMEANCSQANFQGAQLDGALFLGANLVGANFTSVRGSVLFHALPLSRKGADLTTADLSRSNFAKSSFACADLTDAKLMATNLSDCEMQDSILDRADLTDSDLTNTVLAGASMRAVTLGRAKIAEGTNLHDVDWGDYVLGDELHGWFERARFMYRRLKRWYTDNGDYVTAAEFAYRENVVGRKALPPQRHASRMWSSALDLLFGYGERPMRLLRAWLVSVMGFAILVWQIGNVEPGGFWNSLYFSAVSFAALGYGGWVEKADTLARTIGVIETFWGVFLLALFVTTFVRRFTR